MRAVLLLISLLCISSVATTSSGQTGGAVSPLAFGVGSRDLALSGADIAKCDFATAPFWNPARLARSEQYSLMGFHTRLFDSDVLYQYLGIVIPTLDWGSVGIGVTRLGINDIEKRDAANLLLDSIADTRVGLRLGYGRTIGSLDLGMSLSLETHSIDTYKSTSSPGVDLAGTKIMSSPFSWCDSVAFTVVGRNIVAPSQRLADETVKSPFEFQTGITSKFLITRDGRQSLELSGSFVKASPTPALGSLAMEFSLLDILRLRGSIRKDRFSFGAGIAYNGISFDYALVDRELGALHMISVNTSLGRSVSDRRAVRADRRRAAFDRAMSDRLAQKNIELASQLLESGKSAMEAGDLIGADASFDRALFLARSSGIDTTPYATFAERVREQLQQADRSKRLNEHLDSARANLQNQNYLGCQYFAGLALSIDSTSADAIALRDQAMRVNAEAAREQEFIQQRVWLIDSLINYGAPDEALAAAQSVHLMVPGHPLAKLALKKAEFEYFKGQAEAQISAKEYRLSLVSLDSALLRFPGHARCLELSQICRAEIRKEQTVATAAVVAPATLSREVLKQVQHLYDQAQTAFSSGDLTKAIGQWEEVDRLAPGYKSVREYLLKACRLVGVDLYGQNRLNEALVMWEKALRVAPNNPEIAAYARRTRTEIDKLKALSYDN